MADSTLAAVRAKVRRLTRSPSTAQLSDADLDEYVNTFIQYDFPEHLRLFSLRETFTFYTTPNIDTYSTTAAPVAATHPLFNFRNVYTSVHNPVYIAGFQAQLSQSRNEFFSWYPFTNDIRVIGTGNAVATAFNGTIPNAPLLRNNVTFGSQAVNGAQLAMHDVPYSASNGNLVVPNVAAGGVLDPANDINYITGVFTVTFTAAPAAAVDVTVDMRPYQAAQPRALLYFDDEFTLRPVPDRVYPVQMEVYRRPTELLAGGTSPELEQWWQYIAYGAAKKRLEDLVDTEGIAQILPEYQMQERLVLRRTIETQTKERTATIYTGQLDQGPGYNWGQGGF